MKKLIMALVLMPVMALADTEKVGEVTWTFRVSSEQVSVKGADPCAGKLEIPATLGNYPVTSVGADAFFDCSDLTEVVIPEGVTSIGDEAFCDCSGLAAITIPSSITGIGEAAFEGCDILTTVYVSAGDTEGVKAMIADSDSGIDVELLTFVELLSDGGPYKETSKGIEWTFYIEHKQARVVAIPYETEGAVEIPSTLGGFPVTSIGRDAFWGRTGMTSVTIPSGVTSIGSNAFLDCPGLTMVCIDDLAVWCRIVFGNNVANPLAYAHKLCVKGSEISDLQVPEGVTSIGSYAFRSCTLVSATIPSSVTNIGEFAFEYCKELTSVIIPSDVMHIGASAFAGCESLLSVRYNGNAPLCGYDIYYDTAVNLTSYVRIGSTGWSSDTSAELPDHWFGRAIVNYEIVDGVEWNCQVVNGEVSVGAGNLKAVSESVSGIVTIPSEIHGFEVTRVGANAFAGLEDITSVVIPASVRTIESRAFAGCTGLTSVTIPSSVTSIGDSAFDGCSGLTSMTIPSSVTSFGYGAFYGCSGVTSLTLPAKVSSISSLFGPANGIKSVIWTDDGTKTSVTANSCWGCENLEQVVIPASVMNVGDQAFYNCHKLKSVIFEGNAPDVGTEVFNGTPKDLVISVPANSIGWDGGFTSTVLPSTWGGRAIAHVGESYDWSKGTTVPVAAAGSSVTVSNVVVHYILNSVQPEFAIQPADDMNFVNIITEVKGSAAVAIPETWAASYPAFAEKFGTDFTQALLKPSGKIGTGGTSMLVWQDYVAGTDPTDENDVFRASIVIVDGKVIISYTPELDAERKAMRKYTIWGKTSLMDTNWAEVPEGRESEYNFFKVSVEMK